jgi:hypothetical protein
VSVEASIDLRPTALRFLEQGRESGQLETIPEGAIASMPRISAEFERSGSETCPEFFIGGREALENEVISL